jgi:signal transduction histidine kinase/ligand-binding sensor domain-containing protein
LPIKSVFTLFLKPIFIQIGMRVFFFIVILFSGIGLLKAQIPATSQMLSFTVSDGLSDNYVRSIAEDSFGFVWLATANGLNRFNGQDLVTYYTTNSNLPSNEIFEVRKVADETLLLGTGAGAVLMHPLTGRVQVFTIKEKGALYQPANEIEWVQMTPDNFIIAGSKTGVYVLNQKGEVAASLSAGYAESDVAMRRIYFVLNLKMFSNGDALLATTKGYYIYEHAAKTFTPISTINKKEWQPFRSFIALRKTSYIFNINKKDQLFFIDFKSATADTIFVFDFKKSSAHFLPLGFQPNTNLRWDAQIAFHDDTVVTITANRNGIFYATLDTVEMKWQQAPERTLTTTNNRYIIRTSVHRWIIGTESGLLVQSFWKENIKITDMDAWVDPNRPQDVASMLYFQNRFWIGFNSAKEGIVVLDSSQHLKKKIFIQGIQNPFDNNKVRFLQPWINDSLLAGTAVGLFVVNTTHYTVTPFDKGRNIPDFPPIRVGSIFRDKNNTLWISLAGKGIHHYSPETNSSKHYIPGTGKDNIPLPFVHAYAEDAYGNIWMVHRTDGIVRWNAEKQLFDRTIRDWPGKNAPKFDCTGIAIHEDGSLWCFLNGEGLFRYLPDQNKLEKIAIIHDRGDEETQTLMMTRQGLLWLNLRHGISVYNTANRRLHVIGNSHGLPDLYNTSFSLYTPNEGNLILAGFPNKIGFISTAQMNLIKTPRGPYITGIKILEKNAPFDFGIPFNLTHKQNSLRIDVGYINYDAGIPKALEYRLIRNNEKNGWLPYNEGAGIYLANLSPGSYTFETRFAAMDKDSGKNVAAVQFTIKPPFTQSLAFKILMIGSALIILYGIYRYRLKQALRMQTLRTTISGDLHDDIGSRLTQIRFLNVMAKQKLSNPAETERMLSKMEEEIISSGEALDEIVWNMKAGDVDLGTIAARMRRYADNYFEDDDIDLKMTTEHISNDFILQAEQRKDLFLIFRELLTNIRKHAQAKAVEVTLRQDKHILYMEVADNGKGFNTTAPTSRNGLSLLKHRLSKWDGQMDIISEPGNGTRVKITWPLGRFSPLKSIFS